MKPLKNNFELKLLLSILEILCLNPISLVCGILGCVFTANANASFKSERWDHFKAQRKHATIALCVGVVGIILTIIVLATYLVKEDQKAYEVASIEQYNTLQLNGKLMTFPMSMNELYENDFTLEQNPGGNVINPGETIGETFTDKTFEDSYLGIVYIYNPESSVIPVDEGTIIGMQLMNTSAIKRGALVRPELNLLGQINFKSTQQEVFEAYGKEAYKSDSVNDTSTFMSYTWHMDNYENDPTNIRTIAFIDDEIIEVTIKYKGDLP